MPLDSTLDIICDASVKVVFLLLESPTLTMSKYRLPRSPPAAETLA
jgi:hypothetical protein